MRRLSQVSAHSTVGFLLLLVAAAPARGDEKPYFVTYDHHMEEPRAIEFAYSPSIGFPKDAGKFYSGLFEVGYGLKSWWTTEVYLAHQYTWGQGGAFTGVRWENRFRPLIGRRRLPLPNSATRMPARRATVWRERNSISATAPPATERMPEVLPESPH